MVVDAAAVHLCALGGNARFWKALFHVSSSLIWMIDKLQRLENTSSKPTYPVPYLILYAPIWNWTLQGHHVHCFTHMFPSWLLVIVILYSTLKPCQRLKLKVFYCCVFKVEEIYKTRKILTSGYTSKWSTYCISSISLSIFSISTCQFIHSSDLW